MTSVEDVWREMQAAGELGGSRRIDISYDHDAFCTLDALGRRGLLFIVVAAPEHVPLFDAMEIGILRRTDDKVSLTITLLSDSLRSSFISLCDGLLAACEGLSSRELADNIVKYLVQANSLLEYGDPQVLGPSTLRGLIGELIVLTELFGVLPPREAVAGWMGPLKTPQDFVFADRLVETKTKTASSNRVLISSIDQLDPVTPLPLTLAVVTLSALQEDLPAATSPHELVTRIHEKLTHDPVAVTEFDRRLRAANYFPRPYYSKIKFRLISIRYYRVSLTFPRLRQRELSNGVVSASYEIDLGLCEPFETLLEESWT